MRRTTSADTGRRDGRFTISSVKTSSTRPYTATAAVGATDINKNTHALHRWMSRSASAPSLPNRQLLQISGRANKTSTLRLQCRPSSYVQPNYREMIRKRKDFAQRSKSLSASAIKHSQLPNGQSLHAFVTGARYNRTHHLDSRSLECFGLYIPRENASRSFINVSESSSTMQGTTNVKATCNISDNHVIQKEAAIENKVNADVKFTPQLKPDKECESVTSLDHEVNLVFGPSHSSSSSGSSDSEAEVMPLHSKEVPKHEGKEVLKHKENQFNTEPSKETQESLISVPPAKEPVDNVNKVTDSIANSTRLEVKLYEDGDKVNSLDLTEKTSKDIQVSNNHGDVGTRQVQESEHDFISLEALKLTADILQQSSSSIGSSADTAKTDTLSVENEIKVTNVSNPKKRRDTPAPNHVSKLDQRNHSTFQVQPTLCDVVDETDAQLGHADVDSEQNIGGDLASKSSTIFVDMSNLMTQETLPTGQDFHNTAGVTEDMVETEEANS